MPDYNCIPPAKSYDALTQEKKAKRKEVLIKIEELRIENLKRYYKKLKDK